MSTTPASRRDELLELAATMFAERGLRATTVRDIADSAGILSGSLYHHFSSKEEMVDELLRGFLDWLFDRLECPELGPALHALLVQCGADARDPDVRGRLTDWLAAHADLPQARGVLRFLLDSGADDSRALKLALDWFCEHGDLALR